METVRELILRGRWAVLRQVLRAATSTRSLSSQNNASLEDTTSLAVLLAELSHPDRVGRLPLHYLCARRGAPPDLIDLLLALTPAQLHTHCDIGGNSALHLSISAHANRRLLELHPDISRFNDRNISAATRVWKKFLEPSFFAFSMLASPRRSSVSRDVLERWKDLVTACTLFDEKNEASLAQLPPYIQEIWRQTLLFAYRCEVPSMEPMVFRPNFPQSPLLAMIRYKESSIIPFPRRNTEPILQEFPTIAIWVALHLLPSEVNQVLVDQHSRTLLHVSCQMDSSTHCRIPLSDIVREAYATVSAEWTEYAFDRTVIAQLCRVAPNQTRCRERPSGRLPLHVALLHGKGWHDEVEVLLDAYPESVDLKDPVTCLPPVLLAAACSSTRRSTSTQSGSLMQENDNGLTVIYELLRRNPRAVLSPSTSSQNSNKRPHPGLSERDHLRSAQRPKTTRE